MLVQRWANRAVNLINFIPVSDIMSKLAPYLMNVYILNLINKELYFIFDVILAQRCKNTQNMHICIMLGQRWANVSSLIFAKL